MNELPPDHEDAAEVDALYRRMSAADPSQPGEGVRLAVLSYATRRAAQAASDAQVIRPEYSWQRRRPWARPATYGALAAGILAAFMFGPRIMSPPQAPAPAAVAGRAAGPPPVYADLNTSQLDDYASPPPAMTEPDAKVRRVPADAPQRQLRVPPAEASASSNEVAAAAPAAQSPAVAARAEGSAARVSAESTRADAAPGPAPPVAAASGRVAQARLQEDTGPALWRAAASGDLAALRDLHQQRANLNAADGAGRTALLIATLHGHSQAVSALLDYGADPNIADAQGESPLDAALAADESEIIAALKRHGAR